MPRLTKGENFMRLAYRQVPEYIPTYNLFWAMNPLPFMMGERNPDGTGKSVFGVDIVQDSAGLLPPMSKTHDFILDDISKWPDIIKVPDVELDQSAWEAMAAEAWKNHNPEHPFGGGVGFGYFQNIITFMGMTEGLIAILQEPEEVKAMNQYLCDWSCEMTKTYIHYFKPDFGFIGDDIAHERDPFLSLEVFKDVIAPYWRQYYAVFLEADLPVGHHNCGHFELYLDELVDMGVTFWDPVQSSNDEDAIKAKFGNNLALCAGPEMRFWDDDTTEEQIKAEVKDYINRLAPGGGFAMMDFIYADEMAGSTEGEINRMRWIREVFDEMKYDFY